MVLGAGQTAWGSSCGAESVGRAERGGQCGADSVEQTVWGGQIEELVWSRQRGAGRAGRTVWNRQCGAGRAGRTVWSRQCGLATLVSRWLWAVAARSYVWSDGRGRSCVHKGCPNKAQSINGRTDGRAHRRGGLRLPSASPPVEKVRLVCVLVKKLLQVPAAQRARRARQRAADARWRAIDGPRCRRQRRRAAAIAAPAGRQRLRAVTSDSAGSCSPGCAAGAAQAAGPRAIWMKRGWGRAAVRAGSGGPLAARLRQDCVQRETSVEEWRCGRVSVERMDGWTTESGASNEGVLQGTMGWADDPEDA
eukprot:359734-Chlamydomonas_euryale.AAC.7